MRPPTPRMKASCEGSRRTGGYAVGLAVTSLIAGTATAVFGAYHFQRISTLGLAANLAAMPIVSLVVMPFALIGMVLLPFGLDQWAFAVMGKGLTAMIAIAEWFSELSPIDTVGQIPASAVAVLTVALIVATILTTWLRLAAVPVALVGVLMIYTRTLPDALISEDGRLVAVRTGEEAIAVNRTHPNAFTTEDWLRALNAGKIQKPTPVSGDELGQRPEVGTEVFRCSGDVCAVSTAKGMLIVYAANAAAAQPFCATASLIVIDDAVASSPCRRTDTRVVTKRDLARHGGASIVFAGPAGKPVTEITFAIEEPYRPWHAHRVFSREARGLPPYKRKKLAETAAQTKTSGNDEAANSATDR